MEATQAKARQGDFAPEKWRSQETAWMLGLFGTAIGADVLFLPANAGFGGLIHC
ncbi:hypothetical protein [Thauera sp. SDU_THAU2]|uniref:hypothetical protein n=1 Tax=Thauera sp. SDU_THAU2 TaxID=3136633 RepID=UPI00312001F3